MAVATARRPPHQNGHHSRACHTNEARTIVFNRITILCYSNYQHMSQRLHGPGRAPRRSQDSMVNGDPRAGEERLIGGDTGLAHVMARARMVCRSNAPVLLFGETGTGKEIVARAIHEHSTFRSGPFRRVNCGAIAPELIDSELFGHEQGAFTGAVTRRKGWFEQADGGTLFLDEVGELPPAAQVRLLRVVQDAEVVRVGGERAVHVTIRIVAATHRDLPAMVEATDVPRRSVLPAVGVSDRDSAAARSAERHSRVRRVFCRACGEPVRSQAGAGIGGRSGRSRRLSLAGQRAGDCGGHGSRGPDRAGSDAQCRRGARARRGAAIESAGTASARPFSHDPHRAARRDRSSSYRGRPAGGPRTRRRAPWCRAPAPDQSPHVARADAQAEDRLAGVQAGAVTLTRPGVTSSDSSLHDARYRARSSRRSCRSRSCVPTRRLSKMRRATASRSPMSGSRTSYRTLAPSFRPTTILCERRTARCCETAGCSRLNASWSLLDAPIRPDQQLEDPDARGMRDGPEEGGLEDLEIADRRGASGPTGTRGHVIIIYINI